MKKIIAALGALSLANAGAFLLFTNAHLGHKLQFALSLAIVFYAVFFARLPRPVHLAAGAICLAAIAGAVFLAAFAARPNADYTEDAVIVLGAGLNAGRPSRHLTMRLDRAAEYSRANPEAVIVVSGGLGAGQSITEAEAMMRYLVERGVPPEKIVQEGESTSTLENLVFSRTILEGLFPEGFRAVIVTNDFHIFRATTLARGLGMKAGHAAAPTPWHSLPANYLRELLAVAYMFARPGARR
ncbi:MAG: YdcF family protein [Spirochaetes bacterium]|nr:YdcF family protein [Spirochaetota bacterium]